MCGECFVCIYLVCQCDGLELVMHNCRITIRGVAVRINIFSTCSSGKRIVEAPECFLLDCCICYCEVRVVELLLLSENKDTTSKIVSSTIAWRTQKPLSRTKTLPLPQTGSVRHSNIPTVFSMLS